MPLSAPIPLWTQTVNPTRMIWITRLSSLVPRRTLAPSHVRSGISLSARSSTRSWSQRSCTAKLLRASRNLIVARVPQVPPCRRWCGATTGAGTPACRWSASLVAAFSTRRTSSRRQADSCSTRPTPTSILLYLRSPMMIPSPPSTLTCSRQTLLWMRPMHSTVMHTRWTHSLRTTVLTRLPTVRCPSSSTIWFFVSTRPSARSQAARSGSRLLSAVLTAWRWTSQSTFPPTFSMTPPWTHILCAISPSRSSSCSSRPASALLRPATPSSPRRRRTPSARWIFSSAAMAMGT
mmetsp:Transcript_4675/g.8506  ORF Transcript_4675/g.8506 Transcript_4675/m.8506 type:complete len:292 (-) Transcript_4675:2039-2914(-)